MGNISSRLKQTNLDNEAIQELHTKIATLEDSIEKLRASYADDMVRVSLDLVHLNTKIQEAKSTETAE
jgi:hypothetical protein